MALTFTPQLTDFVAPHFSLQGVDGKQWSLTDLQKGHAFLIMFICNHCPYVQAIESRLIQLAKDLSAHQIPVLAISSNDENSHPEDSFPEMVKRAQEKNYSFPYVIDSTQNVAKKFGAVCTPDFFGFNAKGQLCYRGRLDDSWKQADKVTRRELYEAMLEIEKTGIAPQQQTASMGCSIKWK